MKKLVSMLCGLAVLGMMFTSCEKEQKPDGPVENIVEDGFYVVGEATGFADLKAEGAAKAIMAAGYNEAAENAQREGMYEKYIALKGGQPFQLVLKEGAVETIYGATLEEVNLAPDGTSVNDQPTITVQKGVMAENTTMTVKEDGLYHIVLDLNKDEKLADKLILVAPVEWGVRGGMNSWGFTAGARSEFSQESMTYTWEEQKLAANGEFKFAYGAGWKIELDAEGTIKANTNLGDGLVPGAGNIKVAEAGTYKITLTYAPAQGDVKNSYVLNLEQTAKSETPATMNIIGEEFGGWDWASAGVVEMTPVNGKPGEFWAVRAISANKGFKFCAVKEWNGEFTGLGEDTGYKVDGGNCVVEADGIYMIYVDLTNKKLAVEPAAVYGMGDCFGGWDEAMEAAKFVPSEDGKTLTLTVAKDGDLRIYAHSSIKTSDWWTREFNIFDGKIVYRGNDGDQAKVPATANQVVTLDFNAGTGSIK